MGSFDDLIPGKKSGSFDDLIPKKQFDTELTTGEKIAQAIIPQWMQNRLSSAPSVRGSAIGRVAQGMADPVMGTLQLGANVLGQGEDINQHMSDVEQKYQAGRAENNSSGIDPGRIIGNIASPINYALSRGAPAMGTGTLARAGGGGIMGAISGAMQPVTSGDYWNEKTKQVVGGAVGGSILTPILGKIGDAIVRRFGTSAATNPDAAINASLKEMGQSIDDIPADQLAQLRQYVTQSLQQGKQADPAAALRKADFEAMDMPHLLGQITRDPNQFAREQNLRGVAGVGEPLLNVLQTQGNILQSKVGAPAEGALNSYQAGTKLAESLGNTDKLLRNQVSSLYNEARASAGKDLDIPLQGLAQDYAGVLENFADKVPGAVRSKFAAMGLDPAMPSNQKQLFTIENANNLLRTINDHVGSDPVTNRALTQLREAVKGSVMAADASGGPFAPAVAAASQRFKMQDAIPALKAASEGSISPDQFVNKFIVNGKTNEVKGLSNLLKTSDPEAWQEARAQIGDTLKRAAFGENVAGDAPFAASRYMQEVRRLGVDKLSAFFNAKEVDDILRAGRVGAYIKQAPNASAVNTSNTAGPLSNLIRKVPGMPAVVSIAHRAAGAATDGAAVKNALAAQLPLTNAPLNESQQNILRLLMSYGGIGSGAMQ